MTKRKIKINVVDIILILLIIAALALWIKQLYADRIISSESDISEYQMIFEIENADDSVTSSVSKGDSLYLDGKRDKPFATVSLDPDISPSYNILFDEKNQNEKYVPSDIFHTITITADVFGTADEYALSVNGNCFYIGESYSLLIGNIKCNAVCIAVTLK